MAWTFSLCVLTLLNRSVLRKRRRRLASSILFTSRYDRLKTILKHVHVVLRGGRGINHYFVDLPGHGRYTHPCQDERTAPTCTCAEGLGDTNTCGTQSFTSTVQVIASGSQCGRTRHTSRNVTVFRAPNARSTCPRE